MNKHERWLVNREIESYKEGEKNRIFTPHGGEGNPDMWWFALGAAIIMGVVPFSGCTQSPTNENDVPVGKVVTIEGKVTKEAYYNGTDGHAGTGDDLYQAHVKSKADGQEKALDFHSKDWKCPKVDKAINKDTYVKVKAKKESTGVYDVVEVLEPKDSFGAPHGEDEIAVGEEVVLSGQVASENQWSDSYQAHVKADFDGYDKAVNFKSDKFNCSKVNGAVNPGQNITVKAVKTAVGTYDVKEIMTPSGDFKPEPQKDREVSPDFNATLQNKGLSEKSYVDAVNKIIEYLKTKEGDKSSVGAARDGGGFYHVFEKDQTHLHNDAATTSETQALAAKALADSDLAGYDVAGLDALALKYLEKMMPHDGVDDHAHNGSYQPYLTHWMIGISGKGQGDAVFGPDTPYDTAYGLDSNGSEVQTPQPSWHSPDIYKYASAPDGDQWAVLALMSAIQDPDVPVNEKAAYMLTVEKLGNSLCKILNKEGPYPGTTPGWHAWNDKNGNEWHGSSNEIYAGYQEPAAYFVLGLEDVAEQQMNFLKDAQEHYDAQDSSVKSGWFMPNFVNDGDNGHFSLQGFDGNAHWGQFQYRTAVAVAEYYYHTGSPVAKQVLDKFFDGVKNASYEKDGQLCIPTMMKTVGEGVDSYAFNAGAHGLHAQALTLTAARSGEQKYVQESERVLDDLKARMNTDGEKKGSYTDSDGHTFGYGNANALDAFVLHDLLLTKK